MRISDKLKTRRKELGLTQQQVADKVFVTRQTISKWELGKSEPDFISLKLLSQVLDFPMESKEVLNMNEKCSVKQFILTLLFGVLFLPFRILYTLNQQYKNSKILKFIVKPILFILLAFYIKSLNLKALTFVLSIILLIYYSLSIYYYDNKRNLPN